MEYENVKPGHEVAVMTGFRRPLYGRRHPRKDKSAARIMRMKHAEFQEIDKLRNPKQYFRNMKKAQSEEPAPPLPVVHKKKVGEKIAIDAEPIFAIDPIKAYMKGLEEDKKDRDRRMAEDDMKLQKYIDKHKELVAADSLESQKIIDKIVQRDRPSSAMIAAAIEDGISATTIATTSRKVWDTTEPFNVEDYEYNGSGGLFAVSSTSVREELDPTLKKKIRQTSDELADLEYDLTHRPPSFLSRGGHGTIVSSSTRSGRASQRFSDWDDVDLYGLVDDDEARECTGDYPGWSVRDPDEDYSAVNVTTGGSEVNFVRLIDPSVHHCWLPLATVVRFTFPECCEITFNFLSGSLRLRISCRVLLTLLPLVNYVRFIS